MKKAFKISVLILFTVIFLFIASLFVFSKYYGERITTIIITELNKKLNVKVTVESIDFSMFKHFPNASISLNNVTVFSSKAFHKKDFNTNSDTFLTSKHLLLQCNILDILKKNYIINKIAIIDSKIQIFIDKKGRNNLTLFKEDTTGNTSMVSIDLKKVNAENCEYRYYNKESNGSSQGVIEHCTLKGKFTEHEYTLKTDIKAFIKNFSYNNKPLPSNLKFELESSVHIMDSTYKINNCNLTLNDIDTKISGVIQKKQFYFINVSSEIEYTKLSELLVFMPENIQKRSKKWKPEGELQLSIKSKGFISNNSLPSLNIQFQLAQGTFSYKGTQSTITCKGAFNALNVQAINTYRLTFDTLRVSQQNSSFNGNLYLSDFNTFHIKSNGDIQIDIDDLISQSTNKDIEAKGNIEGKIQFETDLTKIDSLDEHLFNKLNLKTNLTIKNLSFTYKPNHYFDINNLNASIKTNNDEYKIDTCRFNYYGSQMNVKGELSNILKYSLSKNQILNGELQLKSNCIDYDKILKNHSSNDSNSIILPLLYNVKVQFETDCFSYQKIKFQDLRGSFSYDNEGVKIEKVSTIVFDGRVSGDFFLSQLKNNDFGLKAKVSTNNIQVDKIFSAFNNFNQKTLSDKNIKGLITSDISFFTEFRNNFSLLPKTLVMECAATINNGRLINFEPMKKLSKFVDISELENVGFSTLKNTFIIRDEKITIPQMEIKSSAISMQISGIHSFSNNYEYNVQVYLSELLAKKHQKKHPDEYFGEVIDDGTVQTKLPLKIVGTPSDIKIFYDTKVAKENIKETFKKEKNEISRIFKEEFGSFKKDSTSNKKKPVNKEETKQKFEIEFE